MNESDANLLETLQRLDAQRIDVANELAVADAPGVLVLPSDMALHDMESRMPTRRRLRGKFQTSDIQAFAKYVKARALHHPDTDPTTLVSSHSAFAVTIFNIGTGEQPGHADDRAVLMLEPSAERTALLAMHCNNYSQAEFVELVGDWLHAITFRREGNVIPHPKAIAALRNISITRARSNTHTEEMRRRQTGSLEAVEVAENDALPDGFSFLYRPAPGLPMAEALVRLTTLPAEDDSPKRPLFRTRIVSHEAQEQELQRVFASVLAEALDGLPVLVGGYES